MTNRAYEKIFAPNEGMLLDVLVFDTSMQDWQTLLDYLSTKYTCIYSESGVVGPLPKVEAIFRRRNEVSVFLECVLLGFTLNCYFFVVDQIELDLLPNDVKSAHSAEQVFALMRDIASVLKKDVFLIPEYGSADVEELQNMAVAVADSRNGSIRFPRGDL
jgi:hypothetical protein